jgi:hypothetical protein
MIKSVRTRAKKRELKMIVTQNNVRSIPRRAVKILPVSAPVKPPRPAPLLCRMTLRISRTEIIISAIFI